MRLKTSLVLTTASAVLLLCAQQTLADFSGPYAPGGWTLTNTGPAPANGTASNDGTTLVLTGADGVGFSGACDTDYTIVALNGTWSFDWSYTSTDVGAFDTGGYLLNGAYNQLATNGTPGSGSESIAVNAGDVIGFRVFSADQAFDPGVLTITNFSGPAPTTTTYGGPIALLAIPDGVGCGSSGVPVSTSIVVPDVGTIVDVDVIVGISHTWYGDVRLVLTHGPESAVIAGQQVPDDDSNLIGNYTLDDEAGTTWDAAAGAAGTSIPLGTYIPDGGGAAALLSNFDGTNPVGTWTLTASDWCNFDVGSITNFTLVITYKPLSTSLSLQTNDTCYEVGDVITVTINASGLPVAAAGGQFFLNFDNTKLTFLTANPGDVAVADPLNPFELEVYECVGQTVAGVCMPVPGRLDYAVGVPITIPPTPGSAADNVMAVLTFQALAPICSTPDLVVFRDNTLSPPFPPSRMTDSVGGTIASSFENLGPIAIDGIDPVFVNTCPLPDIDVNADAGTCEAAFGTTVNPTVPTATDACGAVVTFVRSDGKLLLSDSYEAADSPIVITWTATDPCGNFSTCTQTVTVDAENEVLLSVQLSPNIYRDPFGPPIQTLTRCITLDFWQCTPLSGPVSIDVNVTFTVFAGAPNVALSTSQLVEVPCGNYSCVTARDKRHTLRRTADGAGGNFGIAGLQYVAGFTGDVSATGDWLVGGNLNGDAFIDILDFGVFVSQYPLVYGPPPGNTPCGPLTPHADINGDGLVSAADFTFIQLNFLKFNEGNCCTGIPFAGKDSGTGEVDADLANGWTNESGQPITSISVKELFALGLGELAVADLNGDGWLDMDDVTEFMSNE